MPRHGWLVSWARNGKSLPLAFFPHYDGTTSEATNKPEYVCDHCIKQVA